MLKAQQLKNKQNVVLFTQVEYYTAVKRHDLLIAIAITTQHG